MKFNKRALTFPMRQTRAVLPGRRPQLSRMVVGLCALALLAGGKGIAQEEEAAGTDSFHRTGEHVEVGGKSGAFVEADDERGRVALNFQDVDIPVLARFVSE